MSLDGRFQHVVTWVERNDIKSEVSYLERDRVIALAKKKARWSGEAEVESFDGDTRVALTIIEKTGIHNGKVSWTITEVGDT